MGPGVTIDPLTRRARADRRGVTGGRREPRQRKIGDRRRARASACAAPALGGRWPSTAGLTVAQLNAAASRVRRLDGAVPGRQEHARAAARSTRRAFAKLDAAAARARRRWCFGYGDPVAVAKVLVEFAEQNADKLKIKGGVLDGAAAASAPSVSALAKLPSREVLTARSCSALLQAPASQLAAHAQRTRRGDSPGSWRRAIENASRHGGVDPRASPTTRTGRVHASRRSEGEAVNGKLRGSR